MSLTICLLYFLKVNHHFNFALGYPWKLQIEFFIIGSDNIFSFVFSHLQNTSAIINNTTSRQFGLKKFRINSIKQGDFLNLNLKVQFFFRLQFYTWFNRDRLTRFEVSPRPKNFLHVMSFGTSWDEKLCKQNLFTMLTYWARAVCLHFMTTWKIKK